MGEKIVNLNRNERNPFDNPKSGDKFRVYDATVTVKYAAHGTIVLMRGGKFEVSMSVASFAKWVLEKQPEVVEIAA